MQAGLPRRRLHWLLSSGEWQRTGRGLYYAGRGPQPWLSRAWGITLITGPDAVIGSVAAAHLHRLVRDEPDQLTVFVSAGRKPALRADAVVVRSRIPRRTQTVEGLLCTTVAETILDCAETMTGNELEALLGKAFQHRRCSQSALVRAMARRRTVAHRELLLAAVADAGEGAHSVFEIRYLRTVERAHGLTGVERQIRVGPAREWVDVYYPAYGVIVELDGRAFHENSPFRDRRRDNRNARHRLIVLRYGWSDVVEDPCGIAMEVATLLTERGWNPRKLISCGGLCPV